MSLRVALVGCGAWGWNLLRVLGESPRARVVSVADTSPVRRARARELAPAATLVATLEDALAAGVDAVVIATPAHTHAALTLEALESGADVFVEKPLAMNAADASLCAARAKALGRVGMVGHLLRYHPVVEALLALAGEGALGELRRIDAARLSPRVLTPRRPSAAPLDPVEARAATALWTLGPHDLSLVHALDPSPLVAMDVTAPRSGEETRLELELASGLEGRIALARTHATKERRFGVTGSKRAAVFDDVRAPDRLLVGPAPRRGASSLDMVPDGEIVVAWREPLAVELEHFLVCVQSRETPRTPFEDGVEVVHGLALAELARARSDAHEEERPARRPLHVG